MRKSRVYLAAVAVIAAAAVPAGLLTAAAPAGASTTACGSACNSLSVLSAGTSEYLTVGGSSSSGYTLSLAAASTTNTAQDFTPIGEGTVSGDSSFGILSNRWNLIYPDGDLVEYEYAPGGDPSGLCLANGANADTVTGPLQDGEFLTSTDYEPNTSVTLATCGASAQTLWIIDTNTEALGQDPGYVDLINAGYTDCPDYNIWYPWQTGPSSNCVTLFSVPEVLTYTTNSKGQGEVELAQLNQLGTNTSSTQMWTGTTAPGQAALRQAIKKSAAAAQRRAAADGYGS